MPTFVILQVVFGRLPSNDFVTSIYPACCNLSICTLRFPAVAPVYSLIYGKSASSTLNSSDITANRSSLCNKESNFSNIAVLFFLATNDQCRNNKAHHADTR